jgi:CheY-like chemotaxis protein
MSGTCPRCGALIAAAPDAQGSLTCAVCGARLRTAPAAAGRPPAAAAPPAPPGDLQALSAELREVRAMQAEILQLQARILTALEAWQPSPRPEPEAGAAWHEQPSTDAPEPQAVPHLPRVRHRRKSVLLVDDDPEWMETTAAALERAQVPVRRATTGQAALEAIAAEKPDVLVLELALGEPMPGRDLVNMVKATMEWVDVPVVLHTRVPIASSKEARTLHGADDFVIKGPASAQALVNHVIQLFQRK